LGRLSKQPDNAHLWQKAAAFAARAHDGHKRKSSGGDKAIPYFSHPVRVALVVAVVFGFDDDDILAAALLHDTIEDTPVDHDELAEEFGRVVAELVSRLTKDMRLPDRQREAEYDARLAAGPWQARLIKLADVYDNLSDAMASLSKSIPKILTKGERALKLTAKDAKLAEARRRLQALMRKAKARRRTRKVRK
jgi:(p)ppGpp synthase/HD superfamily hydrolase